MPKTYLFISNYAREITNFTYVPAKSAQSMGYNVILAANLTNFNSSKTDNFGIETYHLDLDRNPLKVKNLKAAYQLYKIIKEKKVDVLHCNTPIGGLLGRIIGSFCNVNCIIYTVHGFHFYNGSSFISHLIIKPIENFLAKYTDVIITINEEDYLSAKNFKISRKPSIYKIPGVGVDIEKNDHNREQNIRKELNLTEKDYLIVSVGELNKNKNQQIIIEALHKTKSKDIHYIIVGDGTEKTRLIEQVRERQMDSNVHFLGYRNDIGNILTNSDIYILSSYREGLSRSIMEAMNYSLPCLVSDIRGNRDLIINERGGYLFNPKNSNELKDRIMYLIDRPRLRKNMGEFNHIRSKKYTSKSVGKSIDKIFKKHL